MAEIVTIGGQQYKKRSPWGVWALAFITLGIYGLVWWYKINDEARRYLKDEAIRPALSVLAFVPGFILLVPPYVSIYRTGERIRRMEEMAGIARLVEPMIGLIAAFVVSLYHPYYQMHLNTAWDAAAGQSALPGPAPQTRAAPPEIPPPPAG